MRKGERTRQAIVEGAARVFSLRGYFGASMTDLTREVGLEKGGLYNHFESKEELALEAFDHSIELVRQRIRAAFAVDRSPYRRLLALLEVYRSLIEDPVLPGGCPILNTAVEADDTHPALLARAQAAMTEWRGTIVTLAERAVQAGELRPETDPAVLATIITATVEGAVMLSKLYGDTGQMAIAIAHLRAYVDTLALPAAAAAPARIRAEGAPAR